MTRSFHPLGSRWLGLIELPAEPLARDSRLSVDDLPPLVERALQLVVERFVDELVDDPLDLVALEHEHGLARRDVDAVTNDAGVGEIEGWAGSDELGGALLTSFLQARDDRYAFHVAPLSAAMSAAWRRRVIALALDSMVQAAMSASHRVAAPCSKRISLVAAQMGSRPNGAPRATPAILQSQGGAQMEALETYTSALAVLSAALLLIAAGLAKKQLVWKRAKPVPARRRRCRC